MHVTCYLTKLNTFSFHCDQIGHGSKGHYTLSACKKKHKVLNFPNAFSPENALRQNRAVEQF